MAKSKPISAISGPSSAKEGKIRSVAVKSFSLLRAQLAKRGLREGASAYMFILNNLSSELGGPLRPFPTVGDEPSLLSQSGESMAGLSKTLAHQIRALCKENRLPQSSALSIVDAMKAQSLEADSVAVLELRRGRPLDGLDSRPGGFG